MENQTNELSVSNENKANTAAEDILRKQYKVQLITLIVLVILVMVLVVLLGIVLSLLPKINDLLKIATDSFESISAVSKNLAMTDFAGTMNKIQGIDIDTLNSAISDLYSVVAPLAKLFGR